MKGRNHVIANAATIGICGIGMAALYHAKPDVAGDVIQYLGYDWLHAIGAPSLPPLVLTLNAVAFLVGSLLPDIDSPSSIFGRYLHFPGSHRGVTHSIWPCLLLFMAGCACRLFAWLGLGYVLHLFWDSFSKAGICWFYPISNYRRYPNGAFVKRGRHLTLYSVGNASEAAVLVTLWTVLIALIALVFMGRIPVQWPLMG